MPYLQIPYPVPYKESEEFWQGCKKHELLIKRCDDCGVYNHPPLPICPSCQSQHYSWTKMSGRGRVECFTLVYRTMIPGDPVPYNISRVELVEQKRLLILGNIIDCPPENIYIDMPVEITFEDVNSENTMFYFKTSQL